MMLRVTLQAGQTLTLKLEGKISGSWTPVLEECWLRTRVAANTDSVRVDLTGVTFVDDAGKDLLRKMSESGTRLLASDSLLPMLMGVDGIQILKEPRRETATPALRHKMWREDKN